MANKLSRVLWAITVVLFLALGLVLTPQVGPRALASCSDPYYRASYNDQYETASLIWDSQPGCAGTNSQAGTHRVGSGYTESSACIWQEQGRGRADTCTSLQNNDTYSVWWSGCTPYQERAEGYVYNPTTMGSDDQFTAWYVRC